MKKYTILIILGCLFMISVGASSCQNQTSDIVQQKQQETILEEATRQVGMPAIKNFRKKKMMKQILELQDQMGLITYSYIYVPWVGKFRFIGQTIGYPIPYSTQFTSPMKQERVYENGSPFNVVPQADPDATFAPASANATFVMLKDPNSDRVAPFYSEDNINTSPWPLPARLVIGENEDVPQPSLEKK
jgi:hypothetical protein